MSIHVLLTPLSVLHVNGNIFQNFEFQFSRSNLDKLKKIADILNVTEYQPTTDLIMIAGNWTDRIET